MTQKTRDRSALRRAKADRPLRDLFDTLADRLGVTREAAIEEWGERAAIRQYLGEYSQDQAEQLAFGDTESSLSRQRRLL